jgi:hypothetical protein
MKYKINKKYIFQKVDSQLVVFDTDKSFLYTFNETAEFILKKIKLGFEEKKIVETLEKKYDVPLSVLKNDVKKTIKEMLKNKIIYSILSK